MGEPAVDENELLRRMDELGIKKAVVLPIISPESSFFLSTPQKVLEVHRRHPTRIIPFCNLDPRNGGNSSDTDFSKVLQEYKEAGCKGMGEITANLYIDDSRYKNLFYQCGRARLPVIFHLAVKVGGVYGAVDDKGLPRLKKVLSELPDTVFIGHAAGFWSEISSEVDERTRGDYPNGPVKGPGRIPELLRKYPNLYGDLSAESGFNAISRDPEYGYKFLEEFQDKLLFGTDICHVNQKVPIVPYLKDALTKRRISEGAYRKITEENARKLLEL